MDVPIRVGLELNAVGAKFLFELLGKLPIESLDEIQLDFSRKLRDELSTCLDQGVFDESNENLQA